MAAPLWNILRSAPDVPQGYLGKPTLDLREKTHNFPPLVSHFSTGTRCTFRAPFTRIEGDDCEPWYDYDDGSPAWVSFYEGQLLEQTDPVKANDYLCKAGVALGLSSPTSAMRREIEALAADVVDSCWTGIEALARELDTAGRVEHLERYWQQGSTGVVERLCRKWVRRFARWYPEAHRMRSYFDEQD